MKIKELTNKEKWIKSLIISLKYSFILFVISFILSLLGDLLPFYNPKFIGSLIISLVLSFTLFVPIFICQRILFSKNKKWHKSIFLLLPLTSYFEVIYTDIMLQLSMVDFIDKKFSLFYFFPIGTSIFIFAIISSLVALIVSIVIYYKHKNGYRK